MTSRCLHRKEVRHATLRAHTGTGTLVGALCTHIRQLFLSFGGPVCTDRISNCPLDRVLTYKNLIYLLNLQFHVIDLSVLNSHLLVLTFKMETAEIIIKSVTKGKWLVPIDLKDVYFHALIHKDLQHVLRFHVDGQSYQFKALPFWLATAPLEFTQVVREANLILQSRRIHVQQYLDDWLLRANINTSVTSRKKNSSKLFNNLAL